MKWCFYDSGFSCFKSESEENEEDQCQTPAHDSSDEGYNNPVMTPQPVRALIRGEGGDSSVVKYKITTTPGYV